MYDTVHHLKAASLVDTLMYHIIDRIILNGPKLITKKVRYRALDASFFSNIKISILNYNDNLDFCFKKSIIYTMFC